MFSLRTRPGSTVETLRADVANAIETVGVRTLTATIGMSETPVAHGLSQTPSRTAVLPHADARVWRARAPDRNYIYLTASVSVECTIEVSAA